MSRASFVLLVVIGVLCSMTIAQPTCPANQEWTSCGSACPESCDPNPGLICTTQCVIGCQCKRGLLRNSLGNCVPLSGC